MIWSISHSVTIVSELIRYSSNVSLSALMAYSLSLSSIHNMSREGEGGRGGEGEGGGGGREGGRERSEQEGQSYQHWWHPHYHCRQYTTCPPRVLICNSVASLNCLGSTSLKKMGTKLCHRKDLKNNGYQKLLPHFLTIFWQNLINDKQLVGQLC